MVESRKSKSQSEDPFWKYNEDELLAPTKRTYILVYQLINLLQSKSFENSLKSTWRSTLFDNNIATIQNKERNEIQGSLRFFKKYSSFGEAFRYLDYFTKVHDVGMREYDKKGLLKRLSIVEYQAVSNFILKFSAQHTPPREHESGQFECHQMLECLMSYLIVKDGVENGTEIPCLDSLIRKLLNEKSPGYFAYGITNDLFVNDRADIALCPGEYTWLRYGPDRLITKLYKGEECCKHYEYFERFKLS